MTTKGNNGTRVRLTSRLLRQFLCLALLVTQAARADIKALQAKPAADVPAVYVLQAEDEITVRTLQAKEIADKTFRLDQNGDVKFPMAGVVHLAGSTVRQAEAVIADAFMKFYIDPDIAVSVTTLHSDPVSILGAVGTSGVYQIKGHTALLEALSAAGGVRGDAGPVVIVTRQSAYGPIPYHDARQTASGESVVEIDLKSLMDARNSASDILIEPHDVVSVPPAQVVYVVGSVRRAGGFALGGKPDLSVLQALSLAEGFDPRAAPERAQILRRQTNSEQQIPVNIKKVLAGKAEDIILRPYDILFVPTNAMKAITARTIEAAIQIGTGLAVFRP